MRTTKLQPRAALPVGTIALVLFMMLFAVLAGTATALAGRVATAAFAGLACGAVALMLPMRWLVIALVVLSFIVAGQLTYFAHFDKAIWFPFLLGALLLVRFPLDRMQAGVQSARERGANPKAPEAITFFLSVFFAALVASTLINASPFLQIFVSSKEYLFLWGLYLVLAAGLVKPELVIRIWAALPWLMLLQLPLIIYQRFVVLPSRIGMGAAWDAVVGAFGGDQLGGGASGAMGLFCVIGIVTVVARWRQALIPGWQALLLGFSGILSIGLAEIKFMILLLPIAFGLLLVRELVRRPIRALLLITIAVVLSVGILLAYKYQYGQHPKHRQTTREYVEAMFKQNADPDFVNMRTHQIGRIASIVFWYREHDISDPMHLLLGHGAGSSRTGVFVIGEAQKHYIFQLTRSAVGILLWETGLIGTLSYIAMLGLAYLTLFRQSGEPWRTAESRSTLASMAVAIAMLAASIPYDTGLMLGHQMQVLLILCLGFAAMMNGRRAIPGTSVATAGPRSARDCM